MKVDLMQLYQINYITIIMAFYLPRRAFGALEDKKKIAGLLFPGRISLTAETKNCFIMLW